MRESEDINLLRLREKGCPECGSDEIIKEATSCVACGIHAGYYCSECWAEISFE